MRATGVNNERVRDRLGRPLHDLRISVTDKCNLRCTYCMPAATFDEHYRFLPKSDLLRYEEIARLVKAFVDLGVSKVRITGGEPLLRRDVPELVSMLAAIEGIDDLALTTNGLLLPAYAEALRAAGLRRVTVSLDAVDDIVFGAMNGRGRPVSEALAGIDAAAAAGLGPVKINAVIQRGVNDHGLLDLVAHFRGTGHIVRFIEYMDVGNINHWRETDVVPSHEILERIHTRWPVRPLDENYPGEVASRYAFEDGGGEIGFISSVTAPFCGACSRARLSADGQLFTCLFAGRGTDLRTAVRAGLDDNALGEYIAELWRHRTDRYSELRDELSRSANLTPKIEMYQIGG